MKLMFPRNIAIVVLIATASVAANADPPNQFQQAVHEVAAEADDGMMMAVTSLAGETGLKQLEAYQRDSMGQWPNPQANGDAVLALRFGEHTLHLGIGYNIGYNIGEQSSKHLNESLLKEVFDEAKDFDSGTP